jgi:hypothetical protein
MKLRVECREEKKTAVTGEGLQTLNVRVHVIIIQSAIFQTFY